jgi:hypothetical protein
MYIISRSSLNVTSHLLDRVEKVEAGDNNANKTFIIYAILAVVTIVFYCLLVFFIGIFVINQLISECKLSYHE